MKNMRVLLGPGGLIWQTKTSFVWLIPLWLCLQMSSVVEAAAPVKIGVLDYRSKPQTLTQWQPLVAALEQALPERDFELEALTYPELNWAVDSRQVDFVLTNPGHYVLLTNRSGLSSALATLAQDNQGQALMVFGGVIFTRVGENAIDSLRDIKGKTIAVSDTESLAGYLMQAYELTQVGVYLPQDANLLITGVPQDNVIDAVLSGHADVGFIRTGLLEAMAREGKLASGEIKIINRQNLPEFPQKTSTRLYPEWVFASMPQTDENLARHVAAALFTLEENKVATQALKIHGFGVPADYSSVEDVMRELRVPPFDVTPRFTLEDVWKRYFGQLQAVFALIMLIGALVLNLLRVRRQLLSQHQTLLHQKQQLQENETFLRTLIGTLPDLIWLKDADGVYMACNPRFESFLGVSESSIVGKTDYDFVDKALADAFRERDWLAIEKGGPSINEEWVTFVDDGHRELLETTKIPMVNAKGDLIGVLGIGHDITAHKQAEEQLHLAASVFSHAREGILITHADGSIIDVNATFTDITGYSREEVLGRNPSLLSSGRQNKAFYESMWRDLIEQGEWSGEIWNRRKSGEVFAEMLTISAVKDDHGVTQHYVALFSDITPFKEYEAQLEHIAHFDVLTGLPNRILLADRMRQAMHLARRRGQQVAVVFLDLDGFKAVNDSYGHDVGDQLLMVLASRMKNALRESDTLARLGGDEFVAVLVDLPEINDSEPMLCRLLEAASQSVILAEKILQVSASIGVSFYPQQSDIDADQLLRQADQAMYQAKLTGKNRYHIFDAAQDGSVRSHHESLEHIFSALQQQEFVLYYQPKVNMRSGEVVGLEALIRWQHPQQGLLLPAVFLAVIENHPLAINIGEWVIDTALRQIAAWQTEGLDLQVSVNVGARQLQQADFVARLQSLLAQHPKVKPENLEIEILESSALEDVARVSQVIQACRGMGVCFALDDFGTGYSSLTYLKHLPISQLKIDQSFVRDMLDDADDLAILEGVIGLAAAFRLEVIAEGVETQAHGDRLLQLGCELAQGYGIARPMPASEIPAWVASWRRQPAW